MTINFSGEKNMLGTVHAEHSPEIRCATDGGASACPEAWEMRHMYVIEATPNRHRVRALDSRTVIYMDSEMWFEPYIDTYDRDGRLFRNHIYWLATRDRPVPDAKVAIYPFKRSFVVGACATDVQSGLGLDVLSAGQRDAGARVAGTSTWARLTSSSSLPTRWCARPASSQPVDIKL